MIQKEDVLNVASLSRFFLEDEDIHLLTKNLEDILHYIAKLEKLDTSGIKPTSHVLPLQNVFRDDTIIPSLSQEEALNFSVDKQDGFFKVPKVIE